jgi:argininosuccinate lyase
VKIINNSLNELISSFDFDKRLAVYDVLGSIAHVRMLAKTKIIGKKDSVKIVKGLESILKDVNRGRMVAKQEDIHYAVEKELIKRIGDIGGKMHTARSRNDQVALDVRMYVRDQARQIADLISDVEEAILKTAKKNIDTVMPGYTHLQHAQPVLFSHHILAYAWMLERDRERLKDCLKRVNVLPLGSAALAGTTFPIDRQFVAKMLGFGSVSANSIDAVSDRDFIIEFVSALSIAMMHLSRICEELIIWSSSEFGFVALADEFVSGSSIMPQKRNPDVAEIIRGKTGRVYGSLMAVLTLMKSLPLAYDRDMQEDKPPLFDSVDSIKLSLEMLAEMIATMKVNGERMGSFLDSGFLCATEAADALAKKGVPFRQAHEKVKTLVQYCMGENKGFGALSGSEIEDFLGAGFDASVFDAHEAIKKKKSSGGTSPESVKKQISQLGSLIK